MGRVMVRCPAWCPARGWPGIDQVPSQGMARGWPGIDQVPSQGMARYQPGANQGMARVWPGAQPGAQPRDNQVLTTTTGSTKTSSKDNKRSLVKISRQILTVRRRRQLAMHLQIHH